MCACVCVCVCVSVCVCVFVLEFYTHDLLEQIMAGFTLCTESECTIKTKLFNLFAFTETESVQQWFIWSQSLHSSGSFGARVCAVVVHLEPESVQ